MRVRRRGRWYKLNLAQKPDPKKNSKAEPEPEPQPDPEPAEAAEGKINSPTTSRSPPDDEKGEGEPAEGTDDSAEQAPAEPRKGSIFSFANQKKA